MTILKFAGRALAMVAGIIGALVSFIVNVAHSGVNDLVKLSGGTGTQTHGLIGLILCIVGLIGALIPLPFPEVASILMLIAGVGMFFIVPWYLAIIGSALLIIGAILAFLDRKGKKAQTA